MGKHSIGINDIRTKNTFLTSNLVGRFDAGGVNFIENVEIFLNDSYIAMTEDNSKDFNSGLLSVFIKYFINPLKPKLILFFRNALALLKLDMLYPIKLRMDSILSLCETLSSTK